METTVSLSSGKRRLNRKPRKRPKDSKVNPKPRSKSPSRHLSAKKLVLKKKNVQKVNKMSEQYLNSFIEAYEHISMNQENQECVKRKQWGNNVFEQTIDLCNDNGSIDTPNSSLILSSCEVKPKNDTVIDLSRDLIEQNEVIDLTGMSQDGTRSIGPTVIDISGDESKDKANFKPENEDILVVGMFRKSPDNNCHTKNKNSPLIKLSGNFNNIINCNNKNGTVIGHRRNNLRKQSVLRKISNKSVTQSGREVKRKNGSSDSSKVAAVGENIYVDAPVALPSHGLRPIIIDGSNVAHVYSNSNFSCKRLEICINYFKEKGHKVTAFVPQFRINNQKSDDPKLLRKLERRGDVVLTPSKKIDGRNIVPYDDRFIVQTAVLKGGIIVTRDNYNDLLKENPAWAETIKYRTLAFTWVDDVLMFPKDPLGEHGPSLEEFLRFH